MTRTCVLEGMPGSGKTTVFEGLKRDCPQLCFSNELWFDQKNFNDLDTYHQELYYLSAEIAKLNSGRGEGIHLLDRSYLSVLAYSYALSKTSAALTDLYTRISLVLENMIVAGSCQAPDLMFVFIIDPTTSIARRASYRQDPNYTIWFNEDFLKALYEFYSSDTWKQFFKNTIIVRIDAMQDHGSQMALIKSHIFCDNL